MRKRLIIISVLGSMATQADILTSTQRFLGMGGQEPEYLDGNGDVPRSATGQGPYSPADSDLGVQEVLVERGAQEPVIFHFKTSLYRTDNAPAGGFAGDESSWVSSSRLSVNWRPHLIQGWFGDLGFAQDFVRYDRSQAIDFENTGIHAGIYKNITDLDDTVFFARYEYQRMTFTSLGDGVYNAQRLRSGLQKVLWAAPRHQLTGALSGAYEWSTAPEILERNEYALDLAYRFSITDSLYTLASARLARSNFDQFGRDDWTFNSGLELIWQINPNFSATAAIYYDKNDSDSFGNFNEYDSWTGGLGVSVQYAF